LEKDKYYHIYNRGINGTMIFKNDENKRYFLRLIKKHLQDNVCILAYCLLNNHFHFVIQVKEDEKLVSQSFSNLFNAYAKAYNKQEGRTGTLFERPFKRKLITDEDYLRNVIVYTHTNPEHHKVIGDFRNFEFSSYSTFLSKNNKPLINIELDEVVSLFEDLENMDFVHGDSLGKQATSLDLSGFENVTGLSNKTNFNNPMKDTFFSYIHQLQDTITAKLAEV
ncbi:unnamed protein product, partial [Ectocarpus sp. 12 AP-2014]